VLSSNSEKPEDHAEVPTSLDQLPDNVAQAVETLAQAAESRRIENICKAYETLKSSVNGLGIENVLPLADQAIGRSALGLIISAYSHENCFMCKCGSVQCEACEDDDIGVRAHCSHCDGTGQAPCEFCAGTGWVGNDVIPHELHRAVWRKRLKHTHDVLEKYAKLYTRPFLDDLAMRPIENEQKRLAVMESLRLASKLRALAKSCAVTEPEHRKHLELAEQKVRNCLGLLGK